MLPIQVYKYRHDLCWRLILQITTAVVVISVIPYIKKDVAATLQGWIVALPDIGISLAVLGLARIHRELAVLDKAKTKHRELLLSNYPGLVFNLASDSFRRDVEVYMVSLVLLGALNVLVISAVWLPSLP